MPWENLLPPAWRSEDPARLLALATLCLWSERSGEDELALGAIAYAVALARRGRTEEAVATLAEMRPDAEDALPRWRDVVADAIAYESADGAGALARLLVALR